MKKALKFLAFLTLCAASTFLHACRKKSQDISEDANGHPLIHFEEKEATCTKQGNIEYWYCTECNKYYADKNGNNTISYEDIFLYKNHSFVDGKCTMCKHDESIIHLEFILNEGGQSYQVKAKDKSATKIIIPSSYNDLPVTLIKNNAFSDCNLLTSIEIPNSVEIIGRGAFSGCSSLHSITIPFVGAKAGVTESDTYQYPFGYIFGNSSYDGAIAIWQHISNTKSETYYLPASLKNVVVTGGNILYGAFSDCCLLESITIPASLEKIGAYAFYNCTSLASINISDKVERIDAYSFGKCTSLKNIYYEGRIDNWCNIDFANEDANPMKYANCFYLKSSDSEWEEVTNIEISDNITDIKPYQFYGFNNLNSITLPRSIKRIGDDAFKNCSSLEHVYYEGDIADWCKIELANEEASPMIHAKHFYLENSSNDWAEVTSLEIANTITQINPYQFTGFDCITSVIIANSVELIEPYAFNGCVSLEHVYYEGDITDWCKIGFANEAANPMIYAEHFYLRNSGNTWEEVTNIEVSDAVTCLGNYQFAGFSNISSITIPNSLTSIGIGAFQECTSLTYMESNGCQYLGNADNQFLILIKAIDISMANCDINSNTRFIYDQAFYEFTNLRNVIIPNGVKSIGAFAFANCNSLVSITIADSVESIGNSAFANCSSLTEISIPNRIEAINDKVFYNCSSLANVSLGSNIKDIGSSAFEKCSSLTSLVIPNGLEYIGEKAFSSCHLLTNLSIPNSVIRIGNSAFSGCSNLVYNIADGCKYLGNTDNPYLVLIKTVDATSANCIINDSTRFIYDYAFSSNTALTSITIPNSVSSIGSNAFFNCSGLKKVFYEGNIEDWYKIVFANEYANPIYYADHVYVQNINSEWEDIKA